MPSLHTFLITNTFVTVTVLCPLNRMGWWWLSRTGSALLSGWFWHSLHTFVLCRASTGYTSRCPVQASGRDWHDIKQRWRKSYIWSSSWHEIPRHGGLRYGAKNQLLYCAWSRQEAGFADVIWRKISSSAVQFYTFWWDWRKNQLADKLVIYHNSKLEMSPQYKLTNSADCCGCDWLFHLFNVTFAAAVSNYTDYLNVEMEMAWKKMVIPVFFFGELNKTMKILSHWDCVWTGNETQHLSNNK